MKRFAKTMVFLLAAVLCALLFFGCAQKEEPVRNFIIPDTSGEALPTAAVVAPTPTPAATPVATAQPVEFTETLKLEMENDEVKAMQQRLAQLGYMEVSDATGYFGTKTEAAVKAFQRNSGLEADGIAGTGTLAALMGADAVAA